MEVGVLILRTARPEARGPRGQALQDAVEASTNDLCASPLYLRRADLIG